MSETAIDYDGLIPNNVGLNHDPRLRRALESWHPSYLDWWKSRGPEGFQENLVYLRTAVGVDAEGWARFGYVRMPVRAKAPRTNIQRSSPRWAPSAMRMPISRARWVTA